MLLDDISKNLESKDYEVVVPRDGEIHASRKDGYGGVERLIVVLYEQSPADAYRLLAGRLKELRANNLGAQMLLVSSTHGGSPELTSLLSSLQIHRRAPVQFFDTEFKYDQNPDTSSVWKQFRGNIKRIPQPYEIIERNVGGQDLLGELQNRLTDPNSDGGLHIVIGKAGVGKTVLFEQLALNLYREFQKNKKALRYGVRPFPITPMHLKHGNELRVDAIMERVAEIEFVSKRVGLPTMEWALTRGFSAWLFDGLDEVYANGEEFTDYLIKFLSGNSKSKIVIFCRDSLLLMSESFKCLSSLVDTGKIHTYRLKDWGVLEKRNYAWMRYESRLPESGEKNPERVLNFLDGLNRAPLDAITSLPFYCSVYAEEYDEDNSIGDARSAEHFVDGFVDRKISRELNKNLFPEGTSLEDLKEVLATVAAGYIQNKKVDRALLGELGQILFGERQDVQSALKLFGLLCEVDGELKFEHDLVAEALAANYFCNERIRFGASELSRLEIDLSNPTILQFMAAFMSGSQISKLREQVELSAFNPQETRIMLSLLLLADGQKKWINDELLFQGRNLYGMRFVGLDLSNSKFNVSDLTGAEFVDCDLSGVSFQGATLDRTVFIKNNLRGASFSNIMSIVNENREILDSPERIESWLMAAQSAGNPRPPEIQEVLYRIFRKFTNLNGDIVHHDRPVKFLLEVCGRYDIDKIKGAQLLYDHPIKNGFLCINRFAGLSDFITGRSVPDVIRRLVNGE